MDLTGGSRIVLRDCLGLKPGESVLIVTDDSRVEIGRALYEEAASLGAETMLLTMAPRAVSGEEPPAVVAAAMKAADVVICPTKHSLTHTNARIEAVRAGARVATMPGITPEMFSRGAITADYGEVERLTMALVARLSRARTATIVKDEHVLTMSLAGRDGVPSTGVYRNPGEAGNLPSGEAYIAPVEDSAEGTMLVDGSMVGVGKLDRPLVFTLEKGRIARIDGEDADKLAVLLETPENGTLCELGIGTNRNAILCGIILEDEKVYGTVHIAFGTNTSFGGKNKAACHMDGIILRPDLYLDDSQILKQGEFLL